jgi:hypothetical protein
MSEVKRGALVLQLTTATQELRPLISTTVAELHAYPNLLQLYNRCDARELLSAVKILLGTVTRTDIQVLQHLRAQPHPRPNALSVNEWFIKLTTTNETLAALSPELLLSPQEIKNVFLASVNSTPWTAEHTKFLSDLAEKEAGENEPPALTDPAKYRKHVEMISRRVANKEALLPLPPSAFGVQSAPLPVAAPVSAPATAPAKATEKATQCSSCNRWHKASKACKSAAPVPAAPAAVPVQTAAAAPPAPPRAARSPMVCFRCGQEGHTAALCNNMDPDLVNSWRDSTACAELKERMQRRRG